MLSLSNIHLTFLQWGQYHFPRGARLMPTHTHTHTHKAIDSVPHGPLLSEIMRIGIDPFIVWWIKSYLFNRSQSVVQDGCRIKPCPCSIWSASEVDHRTYAFLVYINQAANSVLECKILMYMYADDIAFHHSIQKQLDYTQNQEDVHSLSSWIKDNHLKLNVSKCCFINNWFWSRTPAILVDDVKSKVDFFF